MTTLYDTGVLIAADRNDRAVWADHRARLEAGVVPITTAPVVAQASRSPRQVLLRNFLRGCDVVGFDAAEAHEVGALLAKAGMSDVVDAHGAVVAAKRGSVVITSDPDDLRHRAANLEPRITIAEADHAKILRQASGGPVLEDRRIRITDARDACVTAMPEHLRGDPIGPDLNEKRRAVRRGVSVAECEACDAKRHRQSAIPDCVAQSQCVVIKPCEVDLGPRVNDRQLTSEKLEERITRVVHWIVCATVRSRHRECGIRERALRAAVPTPSVCVEPGAHQLTPSLTVNGPVSACSSRGGADSRLRNSERAPL